MSAAGEEEHTDGPEADQGPRARDPANGRMCAVTRAVRPVDALIRFALAPDGTVTPDLRRRLPGRGVWITCDRDTLAQAVKRNTFARGFKRAVQTPADFPGEVERLLERAVTDALAIAFKAGAAVAGFVRVESALGRGEAVAAIEAREAAPDGVRKLAAAMRQGLSPGAPALPEIVLPGAQLDLAFGRPNVIHAALLAGPASEAVLARYRRLELFRGGRAANHAEQGGS